MRFPSQRVSVRVRAMEVFTAAICLLALSTAASGGTSDLAGICYPVNGTGYMVTAKDTATAEDAHRIPIGTLSPLRQGDSLVVQTGTITFLDFRTGESSVYGPGSRLKIPEAPRSKKPSWVEIIAGITTRGYTVLEYERFGGSVRAGEVAFWPDSARFAPGVPILFEWWNMQPSFLRVCAGTDTTEYALPPSSSHQGVLAWNPSPSVRSGVVTWTLLDEHRDPIGGGSFEILTEAAAEAERRRFQEVASEMEAIELQRLVAALLAKADRAKLW